MIWISIGSILIIAILAAFAGILCGVYLMVVGDKPVRPDVENVILDENGEPFNKYTCGVCGEKVGDLYEHYTYCPYCRAKVDWSKIDD